MAKREDLIGKKILSSGEKIFAADHEIRKVDFIARKGGEG